MQGPFYYDNDDSIELTINQLINSMKNNYNFQLDCCFPDDKGEFFDDDDKIQWEKFNKKLEELKEFCNTKGFKYDK